VSEAQPVHNRTAITISLMLAAVMTALDSTIVNVALPHIQGSLSAAADEVVWVLTSYIIASAMVTPVTGWLANRFGLKSVFLVAVGGFTVASGLCGLASGLPELVLFRLVQGGFAAFILPLSQATLLDINPPSRHAQAMAIWGVGALAGSVLGPTVGGFITELSSWRWCFFVNLPVGALGLIGIWIFMPDTRASAWRRFDFLGFGALIVAVASLQLMLDRGPGQDWFSSREIWIEMLLAVIAFWVFLVHTATTREPFIDLAVMGERNFVGACVFMFVVQSAVMGSLAILPQITQNLMGYPVILSGLVATPRAIGMVISMWLAPMLTARLGPRNVLALGTVGTAFALWQMTRYDLSMSVAPLFTAGLTQGLAQGLMLVPVTTVAFSHLSPHNRPEAAAMLNLVRSTGGAIGISVLQALATRNTQTMHDAMAAQVTPSEPVFRATLDPAFSPATPAGLQALNAEITRQSAMVAYVDDFRLLLVLLIFCLPLVLLLRAGRSPGLELGGGPRVDVEG
jgi:DHA2 family multidrug resistance protein